MTTTSQNGWPVLDAGGTRKWKLPGIDRHLVLAPGSAGFALVHLALWFHEKVERLDRGTWDEWGWAARNIRGSSVVSNHASGTAIDLNATRHPLGKDAEDTFTDDQIHLIRHRLRNRYDGVIRWGGDYSGRPDPMHFEINASKARVLQLGRELERSPRGQRILRINSQKAVTR